jgi:hypothetical protein
MTKWSDKIDGVVTVSIDEDYVTLSVHGRMVAATPDAAREIARNLLRKADEIEARTCGKRQRHLRRVK